LLSSVLSEVREAPERNSDFEIKLYIIREDNVLCCQPEMRLSSSILQFE
jgi:hypothetical protein